MENKPTIRNDPTKLYHITHEDNISAIKMYGLVGISRAKRIIELNSKTKAVHFNESTYEILAKHAPDGLNIYQATFMFSLNSNLQKELLDIIGKQAVTFEVNLSELNKSNLWVFNSAIASRLVNYSSEDRDRLASFYWQTGLPYEDYKSNEDVLKQIFNISRLLYQPEYVYFENIEPSAIKLIQIKESRNSK